MSIDQTSNKLTAASLLDPISQFWARFEHVYAITCWQLLLLATFQKHANVKFFFAQTPVCVVQGLGLYMLSDAGSCIFATDERHVSDTFSCGSESTCHHEIHGHSQF